MVKLFVEGGGDAKSLRTECRKGFSEFLQKAGLAGKMPRIVACGSRSQAYHDFCTAMNQGEPALLLVDSEGPITAAHEQGPPDAWQPWLHLAHSDHWPHPSGAEHLDCHLMVQCMESWFLADPQTLQSFFGQGFLPKALTLSSQGIEHVATAEMFSKLEAATHQCKTKARYGKGPHSFKLLALIDPRLVMHASPWTQRFVDTLKQRMST